MNLDDLEATASAATQGPWTVVEYGDGDSLVIHHNDTDRICFMATHGGSRKAWEEIQANAAFIASAHPQVVLALVRVARAAQELSRDPESTDELSEALAALRSRLSVMGE